MTETPDTPTLDPHSFDLDGWLEGVTQLRAIVTLYARRDLMAEIDEIVGELEPLLEKIRDTDDRTLGGESLAEAGVDGARATALRVKLRELWQKYEASGVDFELTQLVSDDYDDIIREIEAAHPDPAFDAPELEQARVALERNELSARLIVMRSVTAAGPHGKERQPLTLTPERFGKITKRFGIDQVHELIGKARSLTLESRVDAPFSQRVSQVLGETTTG